MTDSLLPLTIFVPAVAVFIALLWFAWVLGREEHPFAGILLALVVLPLGVLLLGALAEELWTEHPVWTLDQRNWACTASHPETSTAYVVPPKGGVALPITTTIKVCDRYERKPA